MEIRQRHGEKNGEIPDAIIHTPMTSVELKTEENQFGRLQRLVAGLRLVRNDSEAEAFERSHRSSTKIHPHGYWFSTTVKKGRKNSS